MHNIVIFCLAAAVVSALFLGALLFRRRRHIPEATLGRTISIVLAIFFILFTISGVIAGGSVIIPTG